MQAWEHILLRRVTTFTKYSSWKSPGKLPRWHSRSYSFSSHRNGACCISRSYIQETYPMIVWGSTFTSTQELCHGVFIIWYAIWDTLRLSVIAGPPLLTEQPRVRPELPLQRADLDQFCEPLTIPHCSNLSCTVHNSLCIGLLVWVRHCEFSFKMLIFLLQLFNELPFWYFGKNSIFCMPGVTKFNLAKHT